MRSDLDSIFTSAGSTVRQVIAQIKVGRAGIVLVVDPERRLIGTVTDGDIRRASLANVSFESPVTVILERKAESAYARPITAPQGLDRDSLLAILQQHTILHLPLVDPEGRVVDLVTLDDFIPGRDSPPEAVIMAGGQGVRLRPLPDDLPKPMLPVGGQPLMERTLKQLRSAGINRVSITVHHKPEKITEYFGDGHEFGVDINYLSEDRPLGTAGALGLMDLPKETTLVINGDILTQVDFRAMLSYHREQRAELTMAVWRYGVQVPYGVVEFQDEAVIRLSEKPSLDFFVNAGIYLLEPSVYRFIPAGQRYDMTDLINQLLAEARPVAGFPVTEYWLDVGDQAAYERAVQDVKDWKPAS